MMKRALLIANPGSGKGDAPVYAEKLKGLLESVYSSEVDIRETTQMGDATEWAKTAKNEVYDTVICFGGDGTVSEVINGLMQVENPPLFSFVPMGTANDLGRVLGFEMDPDSAIDQFEDLIEDSMDIGQVNDQYFMDVVAIGDVPRAVMETESEKKNRFGFFAYILDGAKALIEGEGAHYQVINSSGEVYEFQSNVILVALTSSIGGMENIVEHREYNDGLFQFAALKGNVVASAINTLANEGGLPNDLINSDNLLAFSDSQVNINWVDDENQTIVTNVDGDAGPVLPVEIKVHKEALRVLRPRREDETLY